MAVEISAAINALSDLANRVQAAMEVAVDEGTEAVKGQIQDNLSRLIYPPVAPKGEPPAYRSGHLHDEVYTSFEPTQTGAIGQAWPSAVYARIHELSGWAGRGHRSFLPKRPYVEPAMQEQADHFRQIVVARLTQAFGG